VVHIFLPRVTGEIRQTRLPLIFGASFLLLLCDARSSPLTRCQPGDALSSSRCDVCLVYTQGSLIILFLSSIFDRLSWSRLSNSPFHLSFSLQDPVLATHPLALLVDGARRICWSPFEIIIGLDDFLISCFTDI